MTANAFYSEPPLAFKVWRKLGFRRAWSLRPEPRDGFAEGWIVVQSETRFSFVDRLRILVSGRVSVEHVVQTDVAVLRSHTETDVGILPPWEG